MDLPFFDVFYRALTAPLATGQASVRITALHLLAACVVGLVALVVAHFFELRIAAPVATRLTARWRGADGLAFTAARVAHYALAIGLFLVGAQLIDLHLGELTWMFGFLSIGIGFGLQNVTSNFVAGLIVVFERPIKPGDFVTVGEFTGIVREIRLRSTTIVTMDNVKLIVPNAEFISKNVINRSFRDDRVRLHLPVRLTYGVDPAVVREALLAAAAGNPRVLPAPAPDVWLAEFAADALYFELLVWIEDPEDASPIRSALNYAIHRECRARGLDMPHAQTDLFVKSPVTVKLEKPE